jgi:hypothetical protein
VHGGNTILTSNKKLIREATWREGGGRGSLDKILVAG